jgi:iron complex outermembrane receptor protein
MKGSTPASARVPGFAQRFLLPLSSLLAGLVAAAPLHAAAPVVVASDLTTFSLQQLMNMEVTSVTKTSEKISAAPAAVTVLTAEDIRRSGATSLPEALRMVPGVEVSRIGASQWALAMRGFGTGLSRYTLALIDGRSVYNPLFAGTYWEAQDVTLEDIDRIEVIRGPGGALWGSNAVNGVINIITKSAQDTPGALISGGGGSEERGFGDLRWGSGHWRAYGKYADRGSSFAKTGGGFDAWRTGRAGFRGDWDLPANRTLTIQGDYYDENIGDRKDVQTNAAPFTVNVARHDRAFGGNLLGRWRRDAGSLGDFSFQFYYDRTGREDPALYQDVNVLDGEVQHTLPTVLRQTMTYGFGYRFIEDHTVGTPAFHFNPASRKQALLDFFVQDQSVVVPDRLTLVLGAKSERNDYTGWENQPNARLAWTPTERQTLWAAVSRAVRTPSRLDRDPQLTFLSVPPPPFLRVARYTPNQNYLSEKLLAYEAGWRARPLRSVLIDLDGFYNRYDDVQSLFIDPTFVEFNPPPAKLVFPFVFQNRVRGKIYGGEVDAAWNVLEGWRVEAVYSFARIILENKGGSTDGVTVL